MSTSQSQPEFFDSLFAALLEAMTEACGQPWLAAVVPDAEVAPGDAEPVHFTLTFEGSIEGACTLTFPSRGSVGARCEMPARRVD